MSAGPAELFNSLQTPPPAGVGPPGLIAGGVQNTPPTPNSGAHQFVSGGPLKPSDFIRGLGGPPPGIPNAPPIMGGGPPGLGGLNAGLLGGRNIYEDVRSRNVYADMRGLPLPVNPPGLIT